MRTFLATLPIFWAAAFCEGAFLPTPAAVSALAATVLVQSLFARHLYLRAVKETA